MGELVYLGMSGGVDSALSAALQASVFHLFCERQQQWLHAQIHELEHVRQQYVRQSLPKH